MTRHSEAQSRAHGPGSPQTDGDSLWGRGLGSGISESPPVISRSPPLGTPRAQRDHRVAVTPGAPRVGAAPHPAAPSGWSLRKEGDRPPATSQLGPSHSSCFGPSGLLSRRPAFHSLGPSALCWP